MGVAVANLRLRAPYRHHKPDTGYGSLTRQVTGASAEVRLGLSCRELEVTSLINLGVLLLSWGWFCYLRNGCRELEVSRPINLGVVLLS